MPKLSYLIVLLIVFTLSLTAFAQEATPESTPEASAWITSEFNFMSIRHPETWQVLPTSQGLVLITNFDSAQVQANGGTLPEGAIIIQMRFIGLPRVAGLTEGEATAKTIMSAILLSQVGDVANLPEVLELTMPNYTFARTDISPEESVAYGYAAIFSEASFGVLTAGADSTAILDAAESTILGIFDSVQMTMSVPLSEENLYADLPISRNESGFPTLGNADAPVKLTEIGSFDCPHCRTFHDTVLPQLLPLVADGTLQIVYVPIYGTGSYPEGDSAARAALCVAPENFWQFHDALYSWQELGGLAFLYERVQAGAMTFGVTATDFNACYVSAETTAILQAAFDYGRAVLGERLATPSVFVNDVQVAGSLEDILTAIADAQVSD